ncbi:uncharacterized protein C2845_PM18G03150 [Panicum miliaceum]|uniref:Pentatricopeptide repeat-containing protein n=1 Tax=Panicum miliaceum TaxID=4540 RepID=A0A3L6PKE2_PANMI|nr:uncharacterized protein C2845_PM18G03150 [Panicum miliaceum]
MPALPLNAAAVVHHYTRLITAAAASSSPSTLRALLPIHARAVVLGVSANPAFATSLLAAAAPASLAYARRVFDAAPERDAYMWNTLLRAHAHSQSHAVDALVLYKRMRAAGVAPDHYTYPIVLPACAAGRATWLGRAAHGDAVRFALAGDGFVRSALIAMYFQELDVADPERVFAESNGSSRTVVSWTAMVAGYVQNYFFGEAVALFGRMIAEGVLPNEITLISFLPCLQGQEWLDAGEMVHGFVIKSGFNANIPLVNALIAMYGKCGSIAMAEALFEGMTVRSLVSWNTMVAMYEQHGDAVEAIKFFCRMLTEKVRFDCVTLVSVLSACARSGALDTGKSVHEFTRNHGLDTDARVGNVLVDMYAKCGEISNAREVFDSLRVRGVVPWSALISAYANHGESAEALKLFSLMKTEGSGSNDVTFYILMSNMYFEAGMLEDAERMRKAMEATQRVFTGYK